jgi:ribosomal protein RSM22 (predicted rRNA methylase)
MESLPSSLQSALKKELAMLPLQALAAESKELTARYRSGRKLFQTFMTNDRHRLAYLAVRMPATYSVICYILNQLHQSIPELNFKSLIDIGAGPGTASWAALQHFSSIENVELYEKDTSLIHLGKKLMEEADHSTLREANWLNVDISQAVEFNLHDLIILSYVVGELSEEKIEPLIKSAWKATSKIMIIVEPGTPSGFERIRYIRELLIQSNAFIIAPCPHQEKCPMQKADWCHFVQRLERSNIHKVVKEVSLGYEDEKFSYIVAAKESMREILEQKAASQVRILRHPVKHSGHIDLTVCTKTGIEEIKFSRRDRDVYKKARKLEWGDSLYIDK